MTSPSRRFACTLGGSIQRGRVWLLRSYFVIAALMLGAAVLTWPRGSWLGLFLEVSLLLVCLWILRATGGLVPRWIEIDDDSLRLLTRSSLIRMPVAGATARRLSDSERRHLEGLATNWIALPSGGFDSRLLGEFDLYASNFENAVLVEAHDIRMVVTPDDPDGFIAALPATIPPP